MPNRQEEKEQDKYAKLDQIIEQYRDQQGQIIRILQKSQNLFGYLPLEVQTHISKRVDIPISTINGIVSFYSLFSETPRGKYVISVCMGTACYVKGAQDIVGAIKEELQIDVEETSMDKLFTLRTTRCIGACGLAPVITVNEEVYGRLAPDDVPGILHPYIKTHRKSEIKI